MQSDRNVLRAILRLSRHRRHVDLASLAIRVEGDDSELRNSLRRLEVAGLVVRERDTARLTMAGLAVAVALLPSRRKAVAPRRVLRRAA